MAAQSKMTAGPWAVGECDSAIIWKDETDGHDIGYATNPVDSRDNPEWEVGRAVQCANARAMAAAPDLIAALRDIQSRCGSTSTLNPETVLGIVTAALEKAGQ